MKKNLIMLLFCIGIIKNTYSMEAAKLPKTLKYTAFRTEVTAARTAKNLSRLNQLKNVAIEGTSDQKKAGKTFLDSSIEFVEKALVEVKPVGTEAEQIKELTQQVAQLKTDLAKAKEAAKKEVPPFVGEVTKETIKQAMADAARASAAVADALAKAAATDLEIKTLADNFSTMYYLGLKNESGVPGNINTFWPYAGSEEIINYYLK
jgi:flagellar biosynthesis/type III secretory pathway protein FliH